MALDSQKVVSKNQKSWKWTKKKFQYLFFLLFLFNFHILLMLKCFRQYLLKFRQVKNRQFRKQYARSSRREPNSKKEERMVQRRIRDFFLEKIILCASCIPIKCAPFKLLVIFVYLRSFTTVLVRFYRKKTGYTKSTRGTGKVHTSFHC